MRFLFALALPVALLSVGCSSGSSSSSPGSGGSAPVVSGGSDATGGAGNPNGSCSAGVPAKGQSADTSSPTAVVGTGAAASCTFSALQAITDTTMTGNSGGHWTNVSTGSVTNAGTAVGTNARSITITNSTVQGVP